MKILIDMNLSPDWVGVFAEEGWESVHWSAVGHSRARDPVIMGWALANGYIVFTHDLDFGTLLALTQARGPSVIQVRAQDLLSTSLHSLIVEELRKHEAELSKGALLTVDVSRARVRILPIRTQ